MRAKLPYHPTPMLRRAVSTDACTDIDQGARSCIRHIQADAEQICNDAADIENARFLAENIVDTCRRFLANGNGTVPDRPGADRLQTDDPLTGGPSSAENLHASTQAAARAKLDRLSTRELEIFTHLAEGRSAAEIALELSRSSKTINNHRTRILQKLGLKNATELVRLALRSGLVSV